jgi:hypothetical protein
MDALKKYKTAKQCYFQIGGASCTTVPNVGIYYDEYFCGSDTKELRHNNPSYEYYNCDGNKTIKFAKLKPVHICGKSILYLADSDQNVTDVMPIIKQIPGYDSNITYYVNIGTIMDQSYRIHSTFKFREVDRKAELVGVDAKVEPVGVDVKEEPVQVDAKNDERKYHYIIIPNERKELKSLYQTFRNKMTNSDTHYINVKPDFESGSVFTFDDFIQGVDDNDNILIFFLKNKEHNDIKVS